MMRWLCLLLVIGCREPMNARQHVGDFGAAKMFVLSKAGTGSDFGKGSFGGLGLELVTNADWVRDAAGKERWDRIEGAQDVYKLAIDTRGLNLFVHDGSEGDAWADALSPGDWRELFNFNKHASAFHGDIYAFDRHFRFASPSQTPGGSNPPVSAPLVNRITAKGTLKAWVAYSDAGDGAGLSILDGINVASATARDGGLTARIALAAPLQGVPAVEAHYNHQGGANPYRLIVSKEVTGSFVDVQHYDVAHQALRDQRAADHGVTYLFVYGRQD